MIVAWIFLAFLSTFVAYFATNSLGLGKYGRWVGMFAVTSTVFSGSLIMLSLMLH